MSDKIHLLNYRRTGANCNSSLNRPGVILTSDISYVTCHLCRPALQRRYRPVDRMFSIGYDKQGTKVLVTYQRVETPI